MADTQYMEKGWRQAQGRRRLEQREHWLRSGQDAGFMAPWRTHRHALQAKLEQCASVRIQTPTAPRREFTYA